MFELYNQIRQLPKTMIDDAFDKIDQSMADRVLGGWSATYADPFGETISSLGADGVVLFSTSHTNNINGNLISNLITDSSSTTNPSLTRDAIVFTRALAKVQKDPLKLTRPVNLDTLIVSPKNEDLAMRIIGSSELPGSANNDINPLRGKMKLIVWPRLDSNSAGTDTSAYWFLADSSKVKETLQIAFAERPSLDAPDVVYINKNWDYTSDFYFTTGTGYMVYLRGSTGTGS